LDIKPAIRTAVIVALAAGAVSAKQPRSPVERHAFVKANPCPVTGRARLPCPGYQIDHVAPLCGGGADHRGNMQWITIADHKVKTRGDIAACSARRNGK
jgi:hypothetical protein